MENLCLRCNSNPILKNGERRCILKFGNDDKHWDLCDSCYTECFSSAGIPNADIAHQKEYFKKYKSYGILKESKNKKIFAIWYGVSPTRGDPYKFEDGLAFIKRIKKFAKAKVIKDCKFAFEWKYKGGPLNFHGIHVHMLLFGDVGKIMQHINRQPEPMFNLNITEKKDKGQCIWLYSQEKVDDKVRYFSGDTLDEEKNKEKEWDIKTREKHNIPNIFNKCDL